MSKKYPNLVNEIRIIRELRNHLAHTRTDTRGETIKTYDGRSIKLRYLKNGKEVIKTLNEKDIRKHLDLINKVTDDLLGINEFVKMK